MKKGFTLIELMTAVSVFLVVMTISMGSIVSVLGANNKARTLKAVMDNLNFSVETMSRELRFGHSYHCEVDPNATGDFSAPADCASGGALISFITSSGSRMTYRINGSAIEVSSSTDAFVPVTAKEIVITNSDGKFFYVTGSTPQTSGDNHQPKVLIKLRGKAGESKSLTDFSVETLVSQRSLDI